MLSAHADRHGSAVVPSWYSARLRLNALARAARETLPNDWLPEIGARARARALHAAKDEACELEAIRPYTDTGGALRHVAPTTRPSARGDVLADMLDRYSGARAADMGEASIRERAEVLAERARRAHFVAGPDGAGAWRAWERLCEWVAQHGGAIKPTKAAHTLKGWAARACEPRWWRRQLRDHVAKLYERGAYELGRVGANAGQWYCSDRAVTRRIQQVRTNETMMRATAIENEAGQQLTLYDVAQRSVSNKAIRRGELMTRIRGCEEWADAAGLVGLFTTNTCPSRFHAQRKGGGANPAYEAGNTPDIAQQWLSSTWARLRAKWHRDGIRVMGLRVAEPHHDGCPHWHMLLWCRPDQAAEVEATMREWWLKDAGDEPGAAQHRCKVMKMQPGMAAGYVAKYIAKNIDDQAIDAHRDADEAPAMEMRADLLGDMEVLPSMRVEAWAALWHIRQFQAIGQPPVTTWRELRRVTMQQAAAGSDHMIRAWLAAHRERERRADWCKYMREQGGAMLARVDYRLCVHHVTRERVGRYESVRAAWACGVVDRARQSVNVTPSVRRQWGAPGFSAHASAPPWTRFNNCTRHNRADVGRVFADMAETRSALNLGADWSEQPPPKPPPDPFDYSSPECWDSL